MATEKEYREFFLRNTVVTSGTKPDQENAFPISYYIGSTLVYNRFLKNNYPSESVFRKLFESVTFKLNKEDTAKTTAQGLIRISSDEDARDRNSSASNDYTNGVVPHQLPDVVNTLNEGDTYEDEVTENGTTVSKYIRTNPSGFRRIFRVIASVAKSIAIDTGSIQLVNDLDTPGNEFYYGTNSTGTKGFFPKRSISQRTEAVDVIGLLDDTNQDIPDATATVAENGKYLIIWEGDLAIPPNTTQNISYRLVKTGGIVLNEDRISNSETLEGTSIIAKLYCNAIANLIVGDVINLNVDSDFENVLAIKGRSITLVKIESYTP